MNCYTFSPEELARYEEDIIKKALAEKDREIDCLSEQVNILNKKCLKDDRELQQIREHEFQNGYREGEAYMMTQAVRFAKHCIRLIPYNRVEHEEAIAFLKEHKS